MNLKKYSSLGMLVAMMASMQYLLTASGLDIEMASLAASLGIAVATLASHRARLFFRRAYRPLMPRLLS